MSDIGNICYKAGDGRVAFKRGGSAPIFKVDAGGWTTVTFAWGSDGKDLDICAYWDGAIDMKVGYNYITSQAEQVSGAYHIYYSGDILGIDTSEWVRIKMVPWSGGGERTFRVHFNFFRHSTTYPATTCAVIAAQDNGSSKALFNVPCSGVYNRGALTTDPGVLLTFAADGTLQSMEVI